MARDSLKKGSENAVAGGVFLFLLSTLTYVATLRYGFTLDDLIHIERNALIRNWSGILHAFQEPMFPGNLYRPLVTLTYVLTYQVGALSPFLYHLVNVLLHAAVTLVLYEVLSQVLTRGRSFWICVLFAVHPIHVEVVANISGRAELLSNLFGLLALLLFLRAGDQREGSPARALLAPISIGVCLFLALLSKESAFVYLALIPVCYWFQTGEWRPRLGLVKNYLALLIASAAVLSLRMSALGAVVGDVTNIDMVDNPLVQLDTLQRVFVAAMLLGRYIVLSIFPWTLSADYSFAHLDPVGGSFGFIEYVSLLLVVGCLLMAVLGFYRRSELSFLSLWFFISFAITSNVLFPIGTIFAERLAYLPGVGIIGLVVVACSSLPTLGFRRTILKALTLVYLVHALVYSEFWVDNRTLFSRQSRVSEMSVKTKVNYAVVLRNEGEFKEAEAILHEAHNLVPGYTDASFGLATVALAQGQVDQAEHWLKRTLESNSSFIPALNLLGRFEFNRKEYRKAESLFRAVLKQDSRNVEAQLGLFGSYIVQGEVDQAGRLREELALVAHEMPEFRSFDKLYASVRDELRGR